MERAKRSRYQHRVLKVTLALLLCIACVPAQAFVSTKQAWAASTPYAVYYQEPDREGYTLVIQAFSSANETYGEKICDYAIEGTGSTVGDPSLNDQVTKAVAKTCYSTSDAGSRTTRYSLSDCFSGLKNLREAQINISPLVTSSTTYINLGSMFKDCTALERIDWNLPFDKLGSNLCTVFMSLNGMFEGCSSLKVASLTGDIRFQNPASSLNMSRMFKDCTSLTACTFPSISCGSSVYMDNIFEGCSSLVTNPASPSISGVIGGTNRYYAKLYASGAFRNCTSLETVNFSADRCEGVFDGCTSLKQIKQPVSEDRKKLLEAELPVVDSFYIPGATGKWLSSDGQWIPEIIENDIKPEWIQPIEDARYTGKEITPSLVIQDGAVKLEPGKDFTAAYANNIEPGTATVTITGRGIYTGTVDTSFNILSPDTGDDNPNDTDSSSQPGGTKPGTTTGGNSENQSGTKPGSSSGSGSNSGSGNDSSSSTAPNPGSSTAAMAPPLSGITVGGAWGGGAALLTAAAGSRPPVSIVVGGKKLVEGVDFTVRRVGGDKVGEAYLVLTGTGLSKWTRTVKYIVLPAGTTVSKATLGKKSTKLAWKKQASQTDGYQVRYSTKKSMKSAKTKTVKGAKKTSAKLPRVKTGKSLYVQVRTYKKVGGKTYYSPWSAKTRVSNPPATSISKLKKAKRGFTVKWKKQSKTWTTGYQVRYSLKKSMKGAKKLTVKGAKKASAKVSKLKGNKKYYVQVRTYKKVGKKTYYSPWSKAKTVKTKK